MKASAHYTGDQSILSLDFLITSTIRNYDHCDIKYLKQSDHLDHNFQLNLDFNGQTVFVTILLFMGDTVTVIRCDMVSQR